MAQHSPRRLLSLMVVQTRLLGQDLLRGLAHVEPELPIDFQGRPQCVRRDPEDMAPCRKDVLRTSVYSGQVREQMSSCLRVWLILWLDTRRDEEPPSQRSHKSVVWPI